MKNLIINVGLKYDYLPHEFYNIFIRREKMAKFVRCNTESFKHEKVTYENNPVNIDNCKSIAKIKYVINYGLNAIQFNGCNVKWAYKTVQDRDNDYEKILRENS